MSEPKARSPRAFASDLEALQDWQAETGRPYLEFLRVPSLSAGLYVLTPGGADGQQPHAEDEIYLVVGGSAEFELNGQRQHVAPGVVLFVPAGVPHRFVDIRSEVRAFVVFAPPGS